ncbi:dedicator of cytokinesis protein 4 isoform X2 [Aplysia californica]|uniref:Dedicator of cytokinesis protein 4 isoform X2 n=1 Tax=Aplysia californica TaxID=6500 RepID=A0ABM1VNQ4_APLCA|nr:dedicator of cytokinesis protein 4 isoform X2 [Aplysia californica]
MPKHRREQNLFQTVRLMMEQLAKFRSTLVSDTLTKDHARDLKHEVVTIIDWGNGKLGMDLVPRVEYRQADPEKVSVVEMFRIHERSVENCKSALITMPEVSFLTQSFIVQNF